MCAAPLSFSIVTPSFNQGIFLEETIRSVLDQGYPNLEYVVMDGGSSDQSVEVIRKFADRLTFWTSEKDKGHYDAVNKGFARTTGEIMAWINSDDKYAPWAFSVAAEIFGRFPQVEWLTSAYPLHWNKEGMPIRCVFAGGFTRRAFLAGTNLPGTRLHVGEYIQQESTFWRRSLWEKAGGGLAIETIAGDFELWARFFAKTELYSVAVPLGGFRSHGDQISVARRQEYLARGEEILERYGGRRHSLPRRLSRLLLRAAFGAKPLHRLPAPVGATISALGLAFPAPYCHWKGNQWKIGKTYVF